MAVTPRGRFGKPPSIMRTMLSNCASFISLANAANAAAALASIHMFEKKQPVSPYGICWPQGFKGKVIGQGPTLTYSATGVMAILFEFDVDPVLSAGTITGATDANNFAASGQGNRANDFFNELTLEMTSGDRDGESATVSDFVTSTGAFVVGSGLSGAPQVGDTFKVYPADIEDTYLWFMNILGDIRADLEGLSGNGGYYMLDDIRLDDNYGIEKIEKQTGSVRSGVAQLMMDLGH